MSLAIRIENVSKQYRLGEVGTGTLSHDLHRAWAKLRGKPDPFAKVGEVNNREQAGGEYAWALKDVSFEVEQGEILGIIGRNGAGKSTLLKLLSRVTAPTTGKIKTRGRIASLLEVGTGFHPELTGRENVYLNGAIMGMQRHEITRRLDEIIDFSGCAKYIDTPVKRYSSGMMVRLGFAVAAHLECEILIIDEVLAVGDWDFQKKCVEKMKDVSQSGRTLLFVSHNLGSVRQLCSRSAIMNQGAIQSIGDTPDMIDLYMKQNSAVDSRESFSRQRDPSKPFQLLAASVCNSEGKAQHRFSCSEPFKLLMQCESQTPVPGLYGYLEISRSDGTSVLVTDSFDGGDNPLHELPVGSHQIEIPIPPRTLGHGSYQAYVNFASRGTDSFTADSPGVIASFQLYDDETRRGNQRGGVLSLAPPWNVASVCDPISCGS